MVKSYLTNSTASTQKLGAQFIKKVLKESQNKQAVVLGLAGDLGGGKTTFLQGLAKGLNIKANVLSPTFVIMKRYPLKIGRFKNFYHFDCYRIYEAEELLSLGFRDIINNPENIVAIEWMERVETLLPKESIKLEFIFVDQNQRKIIIKDHV